MRPLRSLVVLSALWCFVAPARAGTWQIGPSIGMDMITASGSTLTTVSAPVGSEILLAGLRPGLRIGSWDTSMRNEVFLDTGFVLFSDSGENIWTASNTLNFAHAFGSRSAPYITMGVGFSTVSYDRQTEHSVLYGIGVGLRQRLRHGHGSIRTELRFDRSDSQEAFSEPANIVGVHVGFDLDLD